MKANLCAYVLTSESPDAVSCYVDGAPQTAAHLLLGGGEDHRGDVQRAFLALDAPRDLVARLDLVAAHGACARQRARQLQTSLVSARGHGDIIYMQKYCVALLAIMASHDTSEDTHYSATVLSLNLCTVRCADVSCWFARHKPAYRQPHVQQAKWTQ